MSMTKRLAKLSIATIALSGLCLSAQAQSSVTLEGLGDVYAGSVRMAGDSSRKNGVGTNGMSTSFIGVKGTEDLGNGLKVGFKFGSFMRLTNGGYGRFDGDTFWARDANLTLSGNFGSLSMGRGMAPNFLPSILFNPFGDSFGFSPLILHKNVSLFNGTGWQASTPSDTGWGNRILYTTPNFNGLSASLYYQFGAPESSNSRRNVGASFMYFSGNLGLTGYYEHDRSSNPVIAAFPGGETKKDWMLGGSYDFSVVKAYATYGQVRANLSKERLRTASLGLSAPVGPGKVLAAYAYTKSRNLDAKRQTLTVGYDYDLSKRTDIYTNLMYDKVSGFKNGSSFVVGMRHRF